tara:strand:- start:33 stop:620 length:588 start_codon:yes stop_codon:yes gene_type:complete
MSTRRITANFMTSLRGKATGKVVLGLFVITNAVYLVMILSTIPRVQSYAPDTPLFDLSPMGYSHEQAVFLLESLGTEGRSVYLFPQLATDFVYPGLFAISYALTLIWVFAKRAHPDSWLFNLALLPVLAGLFDYAENILIILMIRNYPEVSEFLVSAASLCTLLKSAFTTLSLLLLIGGFAFLLIRRPSAPLRSD